MFVEQNPARLGLLIISIPSYIRPKDFCPLDFVTLVLHGPLKWSYSKQLPVYSVVLNVHCGV